MRSKKLLIVMLLIGLYISLSPLVAMADPNDLPSEKPECNPRALWLEEWMGVDCEDLMELQADGVGFGVMMKAYSITNASPLSQMFANDGLNWKELARSHAKEEGFGWGQIMKAHFLASGLGLEAGELLGKRGKGVGWGQILRMGRGKPAWVGPHGTKI